MLNNITKKVESKFSDILQTASELIMIPSRNPPGEEKGCAQYIYSRLKEIGYETYQINHPFIDRPQVVGLLRGKNSNAILLNGHIDTVPEGDISKWSMDPFSGAIKDGYLYGRGSVDMKSSLALMIHVAEFTESDATVLLMFAIGEERAEPGTSTLLSWIKKFDLRIKYGLVMEPTALQIATSQKGAVWFKIKSRGKAAHASLPSKGINAIDIAYDIIKVIPQYAKKISNETHPVAGAPTCSITMINGGIKENVIPDSCEIVIDRRLVPGESSSEVVKELSLLLRKNQLNCEIMKLGARDPVELTKDSMLARIILNVMHKLNIQSNTTCFAGATDNEHIVSSGIESLVWGPGDLTLAHAINERISVSEVKNAAIALGLALNELGCV
ncbi:MAG: M20 family metallopeptidase [Nitrososphaerales archaeon]